MRFLLVTGIAFSLAAVVASTAAAQPLSPAPLEPPAADPEASTAAEDPRPAEALTACSSGRVSKGIAVLATLYAETSNPAFVFNQARCYQQNGQLAEARERFREYLRVGDDEPPADVQRAHGFIQEIDRELALRAAIQDTQPDQRRQRGVLRTTSLVLAATSVVAFGTGAFLSYRVQAKERQVEDQFSMGNFVEGSTLTRQTSDGGRLETLQYVSYGVGLAALAGAATTFGLSGWSFRDEVAVAPLLTAHCQGGVVRLRF